MTKEFWESPFIVRTPVLSIYTEQDLDSTAPRPTPKIWWGRILSSVSLSYKQRAEGHLIFTNTKHLPYPRHSVKGHEVRAEAKV